MSYENLSFLTDEEVKKVSQDFGTPVFVYDESKIIQSIEYMKGIPNSYGLTVRYSVKANPNKNILKLFGKHGCHFDVSSTYEAQRVINSGVEPSKVLLTAQELSSDWKSLCKNGVKIDAGSLLQLDHYGREFPGTNVSIRINPGIGSGLVKKLTSGGEASSFGIWHEQIDDVISKANQYSLNIERLHFHIGSGHDPEKLEETVNKALEICKKIPTIKYLNMGGGYKRKILKEDKEYDHHVVGNHISLKLKDFFEKEGRGLHLELEPGTFMMAMSGSLITEVIDKVGTGEGGFNFIKINAGLTEVMRPSYYGDYHPLVVVKKSHEKLASKDFMVCGHCCIAGDNFTPRKGTNGVDFSAKSLPEPDVGDYLIVERAGGYCSSMAVKNFNSYPEAKEILKRSTGEFVVIRNRETLDQITQNETDVDI